MRLLIVEDDQSLAQNLKKLLEVKGFAVDWLESGEKAKTRIALYRNEYDAVILDLTLPDMNGLELTTTMRQEGISTPVIILTGRSETETKVALLNSGADDYIVKPFSTDELIARISSVMRRPKVAEPVLRTAGNLAMDTTTRSVSADGVTIAMTLKEYALLELLLRSPGTVVTREEVSSKVWDFNAALGSNVLDVHIKNLRKKILMGGGTPRIETVRGVGYRLIV